MGIYEDHVLPRVIDLLLGNKAMGELRQRALAGATGRVLELGFGSGTNLPHYPAAVTDVLAVDPSATGRKLARKRLARSPIGVEFIGLDGASLPLDDESVDSVVSTWTLCTIPDAAAALAEVRRVLRPGGQLHFLEHGLSHDARIAARQRRRDGLQQRIAGGCHLIRDPEAMIGASGLHLGEVAHFTISGPKTMSQMYAGTATRAGLTAPSSPAGSGGSCRDGGLAVHGPTGGGGTRHRPVPTRTGDA